MRKLYEIMTAKEAKERLKAVGKSPRLFVYGHGTGIIVRTGGNLVQFSETELS